MQEGKRPKGDDDESDDLDDEDELDDDEPDKQPLKTTFELNDTLYAEAELEDTDTVYLWLGVGEAWSLRVRRELTCRRPMLCSRTRYQKR